jgi:Flp pilus assembly protein CpaB
MRNRTTLVGGMLGALGALLLGLLVLKPDSGAPAVTAYVVREALAPGMDADEVGARVRATEVPGDLLPQRRIQELQELGDRQIVRAVGPGEILTLDQFASAGPVAGGVVVPAGYEAVTIEADPAPGVGGYVTPGARLNVYVTVPEQGGGPLAQGAAPGYTQLVLGHVDVLAVTRGTSTGEAQPVDAAAAHGKVTLLLQVAPGDVPVLIHAQARGPLWFSLVNRDDPAPQARRVGPDALDPGARTAAIAADRALQDAARESEQ